MGRAIFAGPACLLIVVEPDLGTTIVIALTLAALLVAAGMPMRYIALLAGVVVVCVILLATASSTGLPTEPVFLLLGVDQLLDMGRTAVNVLGNCLAAVVMAKWGGEFATEMPSPVVVDALQ